MNLIDHYVNDSAREKVAELFHHINHPEVREVLGALRSPKGFVLDRSPFSRPLPVGDPSPDSPRPGYSWLRALGDERVAKSSDELHATMEKRELWEQIISVTREQTDKYFRAASAEVWAPLKKELLDRVIPVPDVPVFRAPFFTSAARGTFEGEKVQCLDAHGDFVDAVPGKDLRAATIAYFTCIKFAADLAIAGWHERNSRSAAYRSAALTLAVRDLDPTKVLERGFHSALSYTARLAWQLVEGLEEYREVFRPLTFEVVTEAFALQQKHIQHLSKSSLGFFSKLDAFTHVPLTERDFNALWGFLGIGDADNQKFFRTKFIMFTDNSFWSRRILEDIDRQKSVYVDVNPEKFSDEQLIVIRGVPGFRLGCPAQEVIRELLPLVHAGYIDAVAAPYLGIGRSPTSRPK